MKSKICSICKIEKDLSCFYKNKKTKDGFDIYCKICNDKSRQLRHKKEPWKRVYYHIINRCKNLNDKRYKNYGGRGIKCLITTEELKELWFRDVAYKMKNPSIDRIDNDGNYCLENCQFIEMVENSIKDRNKIILQFDLNNNFIKKWKSIKEASNILKIQRTQISNNLANRQLTCNKFIFKYGGNND
jgi:hypothetical protein